MRQKTVGANFRRLPFNFCSISLQPFQHPVCTAEGTVFDLTNILPWIKKHGTNPVNGETLKSAELIKLNFAKNEEGEYVDPVTYKVFTDNTHIVALKPTGNVFAYDTVERLNMKAKMWKDLVSDEDFTRKDIIVLQDPQNLESRNLAAFKYLKDGESTLSEEQEAERNDPSRNVNAAALGNASRILKAKQAVAEARSQRDKSNTNQALSKTGAISGSHVASQPRKETPINAAKWTSGKAAASFTSTGVTPHTAADRAILSEEDYLLKPKRVKTKGYARIDTTHGPLTIELLPEFAPKATWNFVHLAKKGYYNGIKFHRNIRSFMIQGGDPSGTGKGGQSIWGKNFADEFEGPQSHDARGVLAMANKGKNTNGSQFFITYRQCKHLDRKHTIFGRVVENLDTLDRLERVEVEEPSKRPKADVIMKEVTVLVDPFDEWRREKDEREDKERVEEERRITGAEDDKVTWTGKRIREDGMVGSAPVSSGIGKYMSNDQGKQGDEIVEVVEEWEGDAIEEPVRKKAKSGGFGNFDSW